MNGSKDSGDEELLTMLEEMQDQIENLEAQKKDLQEKNSEKQRMISGLSSQISILKSELQKKEEKIVKLNGADLTLKENEKLKAENRKLTKRAEEVKRNVDTEVSDVKREYAKRTAELNEMMEKTRREYTREFTLKTNLKKEVRNRANRLVEDRMTQLKFMEETLKRDNKKKLQAEKTTIHGKLLLAVAYGVLTTIILGSTSYRVVADLRRFFQTIWETILWIGMIAETAGKAAWSLHERIPYKVLDWLLPGILTVIAYSGISIAIFGFIAWLIYQVGKYIKEHFADLKSLAIALVSMACLVWIADWLPGWFQINLVVVWLIIQAAYLLSCIYVENRE